MTIVVLEPEAPTVRKRRINNGVPSGTVWPMPEESSQETVRIDASVVPKLPAAI